MGDPELKHDSEYLYFAILQVFVSHSNCDKIMHICGIVHGINVSMLEKNEVCWVYVQTNIQNQHIFC